MSLCPSECRYPQKPEEHIRFPGPWITGSCEELKWVLATELRSSGETVYTPNCWTSVQSFSLNVNMIMIVSPKVLTIIIIYILSIPLSKILPRYKHRCSSSHWLWESCLQLQTILSSRYYLCCTLGDTRYLPPHSPISTLYQLASLSSCCFFQLWYMGFNSAVLPASHHTLFFIV